MDTKNRVVPTAALAFALLLPAAAFGQSFGGVTVVGGPNLSGLGSKPDSRVEEQSTLGSESIVVAAHIEMLEKAEASDRENASNWSSTRPELANFYTMKSDEVHRLLVRLRQGQQVSSEDLTQALDVSEDGQILTNSLN